MNKREKFFFAVSHNVSPCHIKGGVFMARQYNVIAFAGIFMGLLFAFPVEAQVRLVCESKAHAVVVIADEPTATAKYTAEELVWHVEKATGIRLDVMPESAAPNQVHTHIYVGKTKAALEHGINPEKLPRETFVLRSIGNDLFIVGCEDNGDPMNSKNPYVGTLFGVYDFLESYLGVRWLWPGELGVYVPKTDSVEIPAVNRTSAPALLFRELAWSSARQFMNEKRKQDKLDARLGFSPEVLHGYAHALNVFLRRHRMGGMDAKPRTGHACCGWWRRYGKEHPQWFMLRRDGRRGDPSADSQHVDFCVTNRQLQDFIVEQWDGKSVLLLGPVDCPGRCTCENCRAWDGPQPENPPWFAQMVYKTDPRAKHVFPGVTSDRYARFWKTIYEKAAKRNPDVLVSASFLYENEFPSPVKDIKLNKNIYAEFVQWQDPHLRWFPMPDDAYEWIKQQWLGWKKTGIRMGYRPNYLHDGYVMPHFETRQSGEFFKFAYKHGMEGARFDSLTGQWAVHGPRLYMHLRLLSDPELEIDEIRNEYFSAFGPAAESMERYFDYWEDYARDNMARFVDIFKPLRNAGGFRYRAYPLGVHLAYPPESFEPAEALIEDALKQAASDPLPEYKERVKFIQAGLEHARLTVDLAKIFDGKRDISAERKKDAVVALQRLVDFRKNHEHLFFSDLQWVTNFWERPRWNLEEILASDGSMHNKKGR